jgi:RimJ/RimL family protein N-acetyltransferase
MEMDFNGITDEYYAIFLGTDRETLNTPGISAVYSKERNVRQRGYSNIFDLYMMVRGDSIIASYGDTAADKIALFSDQLHIGMEEGEISEIFEGIYKKKPSHTVKFIFNEPVPSALPAVKLHKEDYPRFLDFYMLCYPDDKVTERDWLKEYYEDIVEKEYCYGFFDGTKLVSVADAPSMPHMEDRIQEIGIMSVPDYRRRGYAKAVCTASIESMLSRGICPLWSTSLGNIGSTRLAYSIGFRKYGDVYCITL